MKVTSCCALFFCVAVSSCSHYRNAWHSLPPVPAPAAGPGDIGVFYPQYGHLHTTGIVAICAGHDAKTASRLAFFSQAPDDIFWRYNAVPVAIWGKLFPPAWGYHQRIMKTLHSLHGGNHDAVQRRRGMLAGLIGGMDKKNPAEHWKIGFLIHALGDSYAHVYPANGGESAYGPFFGHGLDYSVHPDSISQHMPGYIKYLRALSTALGGPPGGSQRLKDFITGLEKAVPPAGNPKEQEKAVAVYIKEFGSALVENDGPPVVLKSAWEKEIVPEEANAFLKRITMELKSGAQPPP